MSLAAFWAGLAALASGTTIPWTPAMAQAAHITLPGFGHLVGQSTYTFEFWINSTGASGAAYSTTQGSYNCFEGLIPYGGLIYYDSGFIDASGRMAVAPPSVFFNAFHHLVFQSDFEHEVRRIVLDGVVFATETTPQSTYGSLATVPDDLLLFASQARMGEVRYWNSFRSLAEINDLKDVALEGNFPDLLACWRCDERGPSGTPVRDYSGNGFDGYIT